MTTVNDALVDFVRQALLQGSSRSQIEQVLLKSGWEQSHIKSALNSFAEIEFPIPVPVPRTYLSAREAFMYLVLFTTLYISAINFGNLIFQFINLAFPDPASPTIYPWAQIRWAVSSLIIAFPVFLYVSFLLNREVKHDPNKRISKIRKWLTYITLFIAASVIIGDLTTLIYNLIGGELQMRFFLKMLTIGAIASAIFGYYFWDMRQDESDKNL